MAKAERHDHRTSGEPLSSGRDKAPTKDIPKPPDFIIAATSSKRRISLINYAFPGTPVLSFPLGEGEPETSVPQKVVAEKLRRGKAEHQERTRNGQIPGGKAALIVADTLSATLMVNRKHVPILRHQSKPSNEAEVQKVFEEMALAADYGEDPYYTVFSASGVSFLPTNGRADILAPHPMISVLHLDPERIRYFASEEGFEDYKQQFDAFYSSDTYTNNGELSVVGLTDLAAGLSVPVLTRNGTITQINNAARGSEQFPAEVRSALSVAAAGIDPFILDSVVPGASERIASWPFLNRLTEYSLGSTSEPVTIFQSPARA